MTQISPTDSLHLVTLSTSGGKNGPQAQPVQSQASFVPRELSHDALRAALHLPNCSHFSSQEPKACLCNSPGCFQLRAEHQAGHRSSPTGALRSPLVQFGRRRLRVSCLGCPPTPAHSQVRFEPGLLHWPGREFQMEPSTPAVLASKIQSHAAGWLRAGFWRRLRQILSCATMGSFGTVRFLKVLTEKRGEVAPVSGLWWGLCLHGGSRGRALAAGRAHSTSRLPHSS